MGKASHAKRVRLAQKWVSLVPATTNNPQYNRDLDGDIFCNATYTVYRRKMDNGMVHLSIKRNDREPVRSWRDLQHIKNQMCGREWEAVELFPAHSRMVDAANQYHLWCQERPFDFGFQERMVMSPEELKRIPAAHKAKQQPVPEDW